MSQKSSYNETSKQKNKIPTLHVALRSISLDLIYMSHLNVTTTHTKLYGSSFIFDKCEMYKMVTFEITSFIES